jgi:hypothetical protein
MQMELRTGIAGTDRSAAEKAAGAQLHRQRMGAIMGPTVCKKRFQLHNDASGNTCMELLQAMLKELKPLAKEVPKAFDSPERAKTHIAAFKVWLNKLMSMLGYETDGGYVELHILREYILVQAIQAQQNGLPDGVGDIGSAMSFLNSFSCIHWFPKTETMASLRSLVPDEADYLTSLGGVMRPWQLRGPWLTLDANSLQFAVCNVQRAMCHTSIVHNP